MASNQLQTGVKPSPTSSSLDPEETAQGSVSFPSNDPCEPFHNAAYLFRHGFWKTRRAVTYAAMRRADVGQKVLNRFADCGSKAWVMVAASDPNRHRISCDRCKNRWCEACQVERRRTVARNLFAALQANAPKIASKTGRPQIRFITLTLKSRDEPLNLQLDRAFAWFAKLRAHKAWKTRVRGGIFFLEVTQNQRTRMWHPHLHVLVEGDYFPQKLLSETWLAITGDSFIVDVRSVKSAAVAASYVAKYAAKGVSKLVLDDQDHFVEAIQALHGRRTFNAFGTWRTLSLARSQADEIEWLPVAPLSTLLRRAAGNDAEAIRILRSLARNFVDEPLDYSS